MSIFTCSTLWRETFFRICLNLHKPLPGINLYEICITARNTIVYLMDVTQISFGKT